MTRSGRHCFTVLLVGALVAAQGLAQSLSERADDFAQKAKLRPGDLRTAGWADREGGAVIAVSVAGIRKTDSAEVNHSRASIAEAAAKLRGALLLETCLWKFSDADIELIEAGIESVIPRSFSGRLPPGVQTSEHTEADRIWWTISVPLVAVDSLKQSHRFELELARSIGLMQRLPQLKANGDDAAYAAGIKLCAPLVLQLQGAHAGSMRQWLLALASHALAAGDTCKNIALDVFKRLIDLNNSWHIKELALIQRLAVAAGDKALATLLAPLAAADVTDYGALAKVVLDAMGPDTVPAGQYLALLGSAGALILVIADVAEKPADGSTPQAPRPQSAAELLEEVLAGQRVIDALVAAPPTLCVRAKQGTALAAGIVATGPRAEFTYTVAAPQTGAAQPAIIAPPPRLRAIAWAVVGAKQ